jgi:hypothetical protein
MLANMDWVESMSGDRLGGGVFSDVYTMHGNDDLVVKVARRDDGTRNWLEFCKQEQSCGRGHQMMPVVVAIWDKYDSEGTRGYVAILERLSEQDDIEDNDHKEHEFEGKHCLFDFDPSVKVLEEQFRLHIGREWYAFDDLHGGNIMLRDGYPVVTDPSACDYTFVPNPETLELSCQF